MNKFSRLIGSFVATLAVAMAATSAQAGFLAPDEMEKGAQACAKMKDYQACAKEIEKIRLKEDPSTANRKGKTLSLKFKNKTKKFTNDEEMSFVYLGEVKALNSHVLTMDDGMSMSFLVENKDTGESFTTYGFPVPSADGKMFASIQPYVEMASNQDRVVQVFKPGAPLMTYDTISWIPYSVKWVAADVLEVEKSCAQTRDEGYKPCGKVSLKVTGNKLVALK